MIETICASVIFRDIIAEVKKKFNFEKDYIFDDDKTRLLYDHNGFWVTINKYTDEYDIEHRDWRPNKIDVYGLFVHKEDVILTKVTPKRKAVIVITNEFITIYDERLYKWATMIIKGFNLDHDGKYELLKCW